MEKQELFKKLKFEFAKIIDQYDLQSDKINIATQSLTPEEAIGITERKDFPILFGKEIMLQADYLGAKGQAFTDAPAVFHGTLKDILNLDLTNDDHSIGLFIASMNAVMRKIELIDKTIHCKNRDPEICANEIVSFIKDHYDDPKITLIGYQPAIIDILSKEFRLRVLDLNPDNVGQIKYGIKIEHGENDFQQAVMEWANLILCTGSTLCNGTIVNFIDIGKEVLFFGTTISATAKLLGLKRICPCSM